MADIELVIKIPKELYEQCKETELTEENEGFNFHIINTVANGTPLPKGHGDLVDRNDLKYERYNSYAYAIANAQTIIDADKESENENN